MTLPFWPLSKLEVLLNHPEDSVQKWAANKLFWLYAEETESRLPQLLSSDKPGIVLEVLDYLRGESRQDLIPCLSELYLNASEPISARAIEVLGHLRFSGAVDLMKQRILEQESLGAEQIAAMIHVLGQVPGEEAYNLLKQTEDSVLEKDSSYREIFYAALLQHRRLEDVQTILDAVMDPHLKEERRREALGLLLGAADMELNPTDVFFLNHAEVRKHWLRRLEAIRNHASHHGRTSKAIESLRDFVDRITPELVPESLDSLENIAPHTEDGPEFEVGVARRAVNLLREQPGTSEWHYGLLCLFVSAAISIAEQQVFPPVRADAGWREQAGYLLRNRPPQPQDESHETLVIGEAERSELESLLETVLRDDPSGWGGLRAVEMLGKMKAADAAGLLMKTLSRAKDELFRVAVRKALLRMGILAVPGLLPSLDSSDSDEKFFALDILGELTTPEGVQAIAVRSDSFYKENSDRLLDAIYKTGAEDFFPFLQKEYRPGEYNLGKAYVHLCRINGSRPDRLREVEQMVRNVEASADDQRRILSGGKAHWPRTVRLELACEECGKKYHYEIHKVHLHPHVHNDARDAGSDLTPYRHGLVICDDLRCKNCDTLNRLKLTDKTYAQLTAESVKILAFTRAGLKIPTSYPVEHVQLGEKNGKPLTLLDAEQDHMDAVGLTPARPGVHLALGKFYEYVKEHPKAKQAYLKALDLDSRALEAMAGLARLSHAEAKPEEANSWIQGCYENLDRGHLFLTEDAAAFKKTVRQKRSEFAREAGRKPQEEPVHIRFSIETPDYPKNKPCPCGSGKKYKVCCMKS